MEKVTVELGSRSYDIVIDAGILSGLGERMKPFGFSPVVGVISNPTVFGLYGERVMHSLRNAGFEPFNVIIPDGEQYKDLVWAEHILTELLKRGLDRNSCIVALGGGVIGDITGFVASTYMRGINFIQVPTTLLAQVDSSVGGKTGVNHYLGKNMIGSFYQPRLVWIDTETLNTLPRRQLISGMAEVIKYGVIRDYDFFLALERFRDLIMNLDKTAVSVIIKKSCEIKAEIVSSDERESGIRVILNFGHTIGHAVETETKYERYLHGEAVGLGMCIESKLARVLGMIDKPEDKRIEALIGTYGLPCCMPDDLKAANLLPHMKLDKKATAGEMMFVLPEKIGKVVMKKGIAAAEIEKVLVI